MNIRTFSALAIFAATAASTLSLATAKAATETVLVSFDGVHGETPSARLVMDSQGNLYGTTERGGQHNVGTVFMIPKITTGYASVPTTLVAFNGINGAAPRAKLIFDRQGNLYGTTLQGGTNSRGTVFKIAKTSTTPGFASVPTILFNFDGPHGANPSAGLIFDSEGNLRGTTTRGGAKDRGTVFMIEKASARVPRILHSFCQKTWGPDKYCEDGEQPLAGLVVPYPNDDRSYATGSQGGNCAGGTAGPRGSGLVFIQMSLYPGPRQIRDDVGGFCNGAGWPQEGDLLRSETSGCEFYGTTIRGGARDFGIVFKINVCPGDGPKQNAITLVSFEGAGDGRARYPRGGLIADQQGNLYGVTNLGGFYDDGAVFMLARTQTGYASRATILHSFLCDPPPQFCEGASPVGGLIFDDQGTLYGVTERGGTHNKGTVFKISGSGFVAPRP